MVIQKKSTKKLVCNLNKEMVVLRVGVLDTEKSVLKRYGH